MRAVLRFAYRVYTVVVFAPVAWVSTIVLGSLTALLAMVLPPRKVSWFIARPWARLNAFFIPMRVSVTGRENVDPGRSYVIVCNHQSHVDVLALYGWLDMDFKWVMKQELRRLPALGVGCEKLGHIFIDRSNRQAALASINAAKERLVAGTSVLFFAEGTRSRDGRLGTFKKGAFRFALDTGLPILPITSSGTGSILPPGTRRFWPGHARLVIHPPVEVDRLGEEDLPRLMDEVRSTIASALPAGSRPSP